MLLSHNTHCLCGVMSPKNRNNFYFPAWLSGCRGYLLDMECYVSFTVKLIQTVKSGSRKS